ncbi:cytochrome c1 [Iodobacter arcticus]|uniref:Cytochrome c1 n=1 Tax=Iodobacter arcticus TaxID=590593 RepID=A0ABW2QYG1_9NEIS
MKKILNTLLFALLASVTFGSHAATGGIHLDKAPINLRDTESLQRGAQTFANYCLSCHGAVAMRYNRLQDIGLTEKQIETNLMFPTDKIGDLMKVSMQAKDAKVWFGSTPPDLSVISRSRGADYLYTYLRSFYRDSARPTGWNNLTFPDVGMPNVLWDLQGQQVLEVEGEHKKLKLVKSGSLTKTAENGEFDQTEFDHRVTDLVNYMVYMGEPGQVKREQIGYGVLLFLLFFMIPISYMLKKEYWRDIH